MKYFIDSIISPLTILSVRCNFYHKRSNHKTDHSPYTGDFNKTINVLSLVMSDYGLDENLVRRDTAQEDLWAVKFNKSFFGNVMFYLILGSMF